MGLPSALINAAINAKLAQKHFFLPPHGTVADATTKLLSKRILLQLQSSGNHDEMKKNKLPEVVVVVVLSHGQCDKIWQNICLFGTILKVLGQFFRV